MDDFTLAQSYDMSEYWTQFDEHSRWIGFSPVQEKIESIVSEDDEIIKTMDYIGHQSDEDEESYLPKLNVSPTIHKQMEPIQRKIVISNEEKELNELKEPSVESRLQEVFQKMKETVN